MAASQVARGFRNSIKSTLVKSAQAGHNHWGLRFSLTDAADRKAVLEDFNLNVDHLSGNLNKYQEAFDDEGLEVMLEKEPEESRLHIWWGGESGTLKVWEAVKRA